MTCNKNIHKAIIEMGEIICPFCNQEIASSKTKLTKECCKKMEIINDQGEMVCKRCGQISEYNNAADYIDFHENKYKLRRKSVYHRKYHVENIILNNDIHIPLEMRDKIYKVFSEIEKIVPLIDSNRKRMISINFLLKRILETFLPDINCDNIKIVQSKNTLEYYNEYWESIIDLIGHEIIKIINR